MPTWLLVCAQALLSKVTAALPNCQHAGAAVLWQGFWVLQYMQHHGVDYELLSLPTHEANKDFDLVFRVADRLEAFKPNRCTSMHVRIFS